MLNYLWAGMILIGIAYGACTGQISEVGNGALESAKEAVSLCITMLGVMSLWSGLMKIAGKAGMISVLSKKIRPLLRFLFPQLPEGHEAEQHISTNIIANVLGLGWAATPAGLLAMKSLAKLEKERNHGRETTIASKEMCTFLIINISSLQLIPVNMIAYRSQYGSVNPVAIVGPAILATLVSTLVAIVFCKLMQR